MICHITNNEVTQFLFIMMKYDFLGEKMNRLDKMIFIYFKV